MLQCDHHHIRHTIMGVLLRGGTVSSTARFLCPACYCLCEIVALASPLSGTPIEIRARDER